MRKIVLIVEDEFLIAMDLKLILEFHGWTLKDGPVTVVAEALQALNVPFLVASAYDRPEVFGGDVLVGAPNVGKPTTERRLLQVLHHMRVG